MPSHILTDSKLKKVTLSQISVLSREKTLIFASTVSLSRGVTITVAL